MKTAVETQIFPNRRDTPKTLIFAKTDSHADDIINLLREVYGQGNAFCKKVTYRAEGDADSILSSFRNDYHPRIPVTVDMIATGTDVKPLEVLLFMRDVRSKGYYEQMKGRGVRSLDGDSLKRVSNSADGAKARFVLIDAVGVEKSLKTESRPLEKKPGVALKDLLQGVAMGSRDDDTVLSLANHLVRLANAEAQGKTVSEATLRLWSAYARVQAGQVKGSESRRQLTDLLSLVRFALGLDGELKPFAAAVCVRPEPMKIIADPACGTGRFFLGAYNWLTRPGAQLNKAQKEFLRDQTFHGNEIVPNTRRMCLMNLFLHSIGELDGEPLVARSDALITEPGRKVDYVLANPPFGKKSSMTITNEEGEEDRDALTYERQDFWETTSNKQLNFLQHIVSLLKLDGKAAVVLPDNVLFEGGAGEKIRRKLLETCDVHTILRLPTGIFYAQGVKANVVFFDAKPKDGKVHTQGVWFYDLRTNKHFTLKTRTLKLDDLQDFITCYHADNRHARIATERFRFFSYDDLMARDKASLDNLAELPPPDVLQQEIIDHLEAALASFRDVALRLR
ncbi:N-6 DNA methylase [Acidithiobacillus sulfurivorans]|uniref:N-6 DNA methylase n=1 Tax=Acidithiobacillus sulfurivorans TaxID=1958756 RepID=UPI0034A3C538